MHVQHLGAAGEKREKKYFSLEHSKFHFCPRRLPALSPWRRPSLSSGHDGGRRFLRRPPPPPPAPPGVLRHRPPHRGAPADPGRPHGHGAAAAREPRVLQGSGSGGRGGGRGGRGNGRVPPQIGGRQDRGRRRALVDDVGCGPGGHPGPRRLRLGLLVVTPPPRPPTAATPGVFQRANGECKKGATAISNLLVGKKCST